MKSRYLGLVMFLVVIAGCAREPKGDVAVNVKQSLSRSKGTIAFDIDKPYLDARATSDFDIIALVVALDNSGKFECSVPPTSSRRESVWFDSSGYKWVRLGMASTISYLRDESQLDLGIDGIPIAHCELKGRRNVKLHVFFDVRPTPLGWSGDGLLGFDIALPEK